MKKLEFGAPQPPQAEVGGQWSRGATTRAALSRPQQNAFLQGYGPNLGCGFLLVCLTW